MFLPLGFVLLLTLLWSGYWLIAFSTAKQRFAEQRAALATEGLSLACTQERWGGYPFHFEFSCTSPVITHAGRSELRSANLLLVALAYAPWQIAALIDGPSTFSAPGIMPTQITHQRALGAVTIGKDGEPSFSAELPALVVANLGSADKVMVFTKPGSGSTTDIAVQGSKIVYAPPDKEPVAVDEAKLQATLLGNESVKLETFELNQGALRYWGSGVLALDPQHRVSGQIDTETNDITALLDRVAPLLGLSDAKLANLRTMLGLLGNSAKAPIIAKDGKLYLGPFQIAELKPLY